MYLSRRLAIQVPLWVTFLPSIPTASLSPYSNHFPDQDSGKLHGLCPVKNITKNEDLCSKIYIDPQNGILSFCIYDIFLCPPEYLLTRQRIEI